MKAIVCTKLGCKAYIEAKISHFQVYSVVSECH